MDSYYSSAVATGLQELLTQQEEPCFLVAVAAAALALVVVAALCSEKRDEGVAKQDGTKAQHSAGCMIDDGNTIDDDASSNSKPSKVRPGRKLRRCWAKRSMTLGCSRSSTRCRGASFRAGRRRSACVADPQASDSRVWNVLRTLGNEMLEHETALLQLRERHDRSDAASARMAADQKRMAQIVGEASELQREVGPFLENIVGRLDTVEEAVLGSSDATGLLLLPCVDEEDNCGQELEIGAATIDAVQALDAAGDDDRCIVAVDAGHEDTLRSVDDSQRLSTQVLRVQTLIERLDGFDAMSEEDSATADDHLARRWCSRDGVERLERLLGQLDLQLQSVLVPPHPYSCQHWDWPLSRPERKSLAIAMDGREIAFQLNELRAKGLVA